MASKNVKGLLFALLRVLGLHVVAISFVLVSDNLLPALVKVNIHEYEILNSRYTVNFVHVEINFHASVAITVITFVPLITYSFLKSASVYLGIFAIVQNIF